MDVIILDMGDDVKGEYSLTNYKDKMELLSFSHGVAKQITGDISSSERTSGKPNHQDMTVTKYLDIASPVLNQACYEGRHFPRVEIIIGRNDGGGLSELLRYTMSNVLISSISISGGGGDKPIETVTLNYNQITWRYTSQRPEAGKDRVVEGSWDFAQDAES